MEVTSPRAEPDTPMMKMTSDQDDDLTKCPLDEQAWDTVLPAVTDKEDFTDHTDFTDTQADLKDTTVVVDKASEDDNGQ